MVRRGRNRTTNISSPCILTCKIKDGLCIGCRRTADEISKWSWIEESERLEIMEELKTR